MPALDHPRFDVVENLSKLRSTSLWFSQIGGPAISRPAQEELQLAAIQLQTYPWSDEHDHARLQQAGKASAVAFASCPQPFLDEKGKWHLAGVKIAPDPVQVATERKIEILRDLIRKNPHFGQEKLAKLAAREEGFSRDQAVKLLKEGMSRQWVASTTAHGKRCYQLLWAQLPLEPGINTTGF